MAVERVKIVLDADVIIHFSKGNLLSVLPTIFPEYEYVVLDKVYDELISVRIQLDNQISLLKNITLEAFPLNHDIMREYSLLSRTFGKGESACMAYCRFTSNVIGSSNLRDIKKYCREHKITYLTTLDFLFYAWKKNLLTEKQCTDFIVEVTSKGSRLPDITSIMGYVPNVLI